MGASIFLMNKKYEKSINLSKRDELWQDAMSSCAASNDPKLAEDLLRFFVEQGNEAAFGACLYTCGSLIKPDVAMELAWRNNLMDYAMPFMIRTIRNFDQNLQ